jgi:2-phosphosulfolactate phosphatase
MRVDVFAVYNEIFERDTRDRTVVVLDILRATSTMITAVNNGAIKVIPVVEVDDAVAMMRTLDRKEALIAGERNALPLPGFDMGNSPLEFTQDKVRGKTVVISTTNGTSALQAVKNASRVLIGALINKTAVARAIQNRGEDVCIVCAGTGGKFSADDIYGAGAIISALQELGVAVECNDLGYVSELLYNSDRGRLGLISNSHHYKLLLELGMQEDIEYCFTEDVTDCVPIYAAGLIEGGPARE